MYALKEVLDALQNEPLSAALGKLEAFATATAQSDLALWAGAELSGYSSRNQEVELPEYRKVGVQWLDAYSRPVQLDVADKRLEGLLLRLPLPTGVDELEPFSANGLVMNHPGIQRQLTKLITDRWGEPMQFSGARVSGQAVQGLLQRIRAEARRRVQQALPTASSSTTVRPLPDLTWMTDADLKAILEERWKEADAAQRAGAPLATIILLGSILEGALLHKAESNPAKANSAASAPKETDTSGTLKVKRFPFWTLDNLLTVAHEVGWLGREVKDFSVVLRMYRNFVHPGEQKRQGITPSSGICDVCWPVVTAALTDLARP